MRIRGRGMTLSNGVSSLLCDTMIPKKNWYAHLRIVCVDTNNFELHGYKRRKSSTAFVSGRITVTVFETLRVQLFRSVQLFFFFTNLQTYSLFDGF